MTNDQRVEAHINSNAEMLLRLSLTVANAFPHLQPEISGNLDEWIRVRDKIEAEFKDGVNNEPPKINKG